MGKIEDQILNVEEVAIAVEDVEAAVGTYQTVFGLEFDDQWRIEDDHIQVYATTVAGTQVHLLEPTQKAGPVYSFLQNQGEGIHHFCFEVENLDLTISHLREIGARLVPETPARHDGSSYIFVHPETTHGVLVELIEYNK